VGCNFAYRLREVPLAHTTATGKDMMNPYNSLADDYYVNMNLSTEMELSGSRETILHYFEQMQKKFATC
jgi:hypothetical protein